MMRIEPTKPAGGAWDEQALHAIGAMAIAEIRDADGTLVGLDLSPAIDLGAYAAAEAAERVRRLKAHAADRRYAFETAGIVVSGMPVATDRASQGMINGALSYLGARPSGEVIRFKTASGFVELDLAQVTALGLAVGAHVQDAFAREADAIAGIEGGLLTTSADIDGFFA